MENNTNFIEKENIYSIDIIRIVLSIIILMRHSVQWFYSSDDLLYKIVNGISPICVPLFFSISSYLFFRKERTKEYLCKYLKKLLLEYIIWSIIYLPLMIDTIITNGILNYLKCLIFDGGYYHLWYYPSLIISILIMYYIKKNNVLLLLFGFILYSIGTIVDTYSYIIPNIDFSLYRSIFITTRNGIFYGLPFVIIGRFLTFKQYKTNLILLILAFIIYLIEGIYNSFIFNNEINNMFITSYLLVPLILISLLNINIKGNKNIKLISKILYLIHPLIIFISFMIIRNIVGFLLSIILSICVSYIIYRLREYRVIKFLFK